MTHEDEFTCHGNDFSLWKQLYNDLSGSGGNSVKSCENNPDDVIITCYEITKLLKACFYKLGMYRLKDMAIYDARKV